MDNLLKLLDIDSCDNSSISEAVRNTLKDFEIEVNDTIEDLANESFGPFMITMFALFSQLTTALSTNLSSFLLTSVAGNVVGGLLSSAGLAINLLSGSQIVLKYQAAKRLSQVLQNRIGVSESLLFDIGELIDVLQSLENLNQETSDILFFDIDRAYENIKKAALLVGIEYGKIENAA